MNTIQLETIDFKPGKSFKLFSPRLRNTFLWHYHPEFELVYVEADAGIRHVGTHISTYTRSDLVFIGSNLPHLNFDYRLRSDYHQIVIQLRCDFMGTALGLTPEFASIAKLFRTAEYGIAFDGETKQEVAKKLRQLQGSSEQLQDSSGQSRSSSGQSRISSPKQPESPSSLEQLLQLIDIFQILADSDEKTILNKDGSSQNFILKDKIRMGAIYEYIDAEYHRDPDVNIVAQKVNLTTPAFCRYFRRQTNMTFTEFVNQYRIERAKNLLMQNNNVSETCYAVGIDSLSYFNKLFKEIAGENPSDFRRRYNDNNVTAR
jgi:AraC-like DNA-binding protein